MSSTPIAERLGAAVSGLFRSAAVLVLPAGIFLASVAGPATAGSADTGANASAPAAQSHAATKTVPRIAVVSAFEPEWQSLQADLRDAERTQINGIDFVTGKLSGKDVVLFLSGVSMVNAAMTTQLALDRFDIQAIVFSGIAGGVDAALSIGDVVVAER